MRRFEVSEYRIADKDDAIDSDERQRRLGQVYVLLIDLAREKRTAAQTKPADTTEITA